MIAVETTFHDGLVRKIGNSAVKKRENYIVILKVADA